MARVKGGAASHARHKKIIKMARGYRGRNNSAHRIAVEKVEKGLLYAYRDRRVRKRSFRSLWLQRVNAAARRDGRPYSQFMNGLARAGIELDRKVLADIAVREPETFKALTEQAQKALKSAA